LMSIARRESAFNSHARSPVGARGLMQMMPATAKQVAREKAFTLTDEKALLDSDVNIHLATYYVSSLLEKYNGNLIAALAGYNAGPNKVDRWLESAPVTFDQFIESIPYRETREYVKAVLAYRVIFNTLQGTEVSAVLNPDERSFAQFISSAELQAEGPITN
jgi:soluble lytic murein transglycosylase